MSVLTKKKRLRLGAVLKQQTTKNRKFTVFLYASGIQQYRSRANYIRGGMPRTITLERHVPRKTEQRHKDASNRRRKWCLVIRDPWHDDIRFAPIYAGPFESLELALLAWELMS